MIIFSALPEEVKGLPLEYYEVFLTGVGMINATLNLTDFILLSPMVVQIILSVMFGRLWVSKSYCA